MREVSSFLTLFKFSAKLTILTICLTAKLVGASGNSTVVSTGETVIVSPLSFAVLGQNATFRQNFKDFFNPTNSTPPFFQLFHPGFQAILGSNAFVRRIATNTTFASGSFAFEAPIFNPPTNELFFASGLLPPESSMTHNNRVSKINMTMVDISLERKATDINIPFTTLSLPETVQVTNGGTGPFKGSLLFATRGRQNLPPALVLVNPTAPNNATVLLDNFFGRQFNSMNDLKIHPSGNIFFTDDTFGFVNDQRPPPSLPSQSYMFDPETGLVRMVSDGAITPNGIAFNADGSVAYIADSSALINNTLSATIYAYDVDAKTFAFNNRRVFAFIDTGIPDGIQVDTNGNVYAGCGDGVQIFREDGVLLGKIFVGANVANMAFAGDGRLVILAGSSIFLAQIEAKSALFTI
uniref:SMP-30/Gluconolactonase/LRE-like region domain-containing protein n=2 Tax=Psilocybe cubensis TaxID=181762 RepID=A0A8H7XJ86_PSICU